MKSNFRLILIASALLLICSAGQLQAQKLKTITEYFQDSARAKKVEYVYTVLDKPPYDIKHGTYKWFFDNGNVKALTTYADGNKNGKFITYNRWGTKRAEGTFKNNQLIGEFRNYFPGGGLDYVGSYENGYRHGSWKYYHESGALKKVVEYNMGREVNPDTAKGN
ncbi:MAG: hypothetical protein H6581_09120 [Bacteroidia bacterium]|nr:hypothetical protein [Bacteroidia bacterium]